jgi:hypothetical protein
MVPINVVGAAYQTDIPTTIEPLEIAVTVNTFVALDAVKLQAAEVEAQFAVLELFQVPTLPRQYLVAILNPRFLY